ncbi:DUF2975 domain-containing protein [Bacillus cereus]|uniref:DUF2975 domain-containing protein n=1 Tax=Bacillus cereus TaxID=1396 RepID=UPI001879AF17|nr:DUF2975 domain-containing protein [Bacillus cereus]MBE7106361.1 DUF2975 domain-containing protein [Bacillus cereus]MBE7124010.1 DUF2975 domain-containing protein [Bacillus cereus]
MNQAKEFIGFEKTLKLLQGLFNIFYWIIIIGMFVALGGMIAGIFVPLHTLQDILTAKGTHIHVAFYHSYRIDTNHIQYTNLKTLVIGACLIYEIILAVLLFLIIQLKGIIRFVRNKQPFSKKCINYIQYLAYGVISYSLIDGVLGGILDFLFVRTFQLTQSKVSFELNFGLLITGLLILLLSNIFKYGAYLQEEYDSTL